MRELWNKIFSESLTTAESQADEISMKTFQDNASFKQYLLDDPRVAQYCTAEELDNILNPHTYTGFSCKLTEKVVENIKNKRVAKMG